MNLIKRLSPLNERLQGRFGLDGDIFLLPAPGSYDGVIDGFFPEAPKKNGNSATHYVLWLDNLHGSYGKWASYVSVRGKNFSFKPNSSFSVEGTIEKMGSVNNFRYYFVKIRKLTHPKLSKK